MQILGYLLTILNSGWFSSFIGIIGLILGFTFFMASRASSKLRFKASNIRLIGSKSPEMPSDVQIMYRDQAVNTLSKSRIVVWNDGNQTIRGSDIVHDDPLRWRFDDGEILQASVIGTTRDVNKVYVENSFDRKQGLLTFDFLDRHDGATIEILHTSVQSSLQLLGTIKGMPAGIQPVGGRNYEHLVMGPLDRIVKERSKRKLVKWAILTITSSLGGLLLFFAYIRPSEGNCTTTTNYRFIPYVLGVIYLLAPFILAFAGRRRYPKKLDLI